jgi:hypothetical protein
MAELFVVPKQQFEQPAESEEIDPEVFEVTGDTKADLETAMRALAFLIDWVNEVGAEGIRKGANEIRAFRGEQK